MKDGKYVLVLCNTSSNAPAQGVACLHEIPHPAEYSIQAVLDTKNRIEKSVFTWEGRSQPSLEIENLPPQSVLSLYLDKMP